jgi:urocanate hydratase
LIDCCGHVADIGPQGIVHGTTITILNAGRKYLGSSELAGKVYISSGLGGMSGAQAKAAVICGAIGVVAEVNGTTHQYFLSLSLSLSLSVCVCAHSGV